MTHPFVLWNIALASFGMALGLFFAAALMRLRHAKTAHRFLAAFCLCFALLMAGDLLIAIFVNPQNPSSLHWSGNLLDGVFLLLTPLFYFYVITLVNGRFVRKPLAYVAFLPAIFCAAWVGLRIFSPNAIEKNTLQEFMPPAYTWVFLLLAIGQLLLYAPLIYRAVSAYTAEVQNNLSSLQNIDLHWLKTLIVAAAISALFWLLSVVFHHPAFAAVSAALPPLLLLLLGIRALQQMPLPSDGVAIADVGPSGVDKAASEPAPSSAKYAKSGLTPERLQACSQQLEQFMRQEKAFLEGDLTLTELAQRLGMPQHQLSQVLNQQLGMSFFEYINRLRVQEAERCLEDAGFAQQTLLEIGMAAGFNSKAAFNAAFKRYSGITPSEFRAKTGPIKA